MRFADLLALTASASVAVSFSMSGSNSAVAAAVGEPQGGNAGAVAAGGIPATGINAAPNSHFQSAMDAANAASAAHHATMASIHKQQQELHAQHMAAHHARLSAMGGQAGVHGGLKAGVGAAGGIDAAVGARLHHQHPVPQPTPAESPATSIVVAEGGEKVPKKAPNVPSTSNPSEEEHKFKKTTTISYAKPDMISPKTKVDLISAPGTHWVGDGFKVHGMFHYGEGAESRSPFLLLDYAQAHHFSPDPKHETGHRRGVGTHPHKGFETVTIAFQGEVQHRDSSGGGGVIGPGDCQWMTAGKGIQHEEFHSDAFSKTGGVFEMMQLWVNLPRKYKDAPPGYQSILNSTVPAVPLAPVGIATITTTSKEVHRASYADEDGSTAAKASSASSSSSTSSKTQQMVADLSFGHVRVFAGEFNGQKGPARTFTPMNVWDVRIKAPKKSDEDDNEDDSTISVSDRTVDENGNVVSQSHSKSSSKKTKSATKGDHLPSYDFPQTEGWTVLIAVMKGAIEVNGVRVNAHQLVHLSNKGAGVRITPLPLEEVEAKEGKKSAKEDAQTGSDKDDEEYKLLFLAGEPFDEPVVGHGPFVMTSQAEIQQAFADFRAGRF